MSVEYYKSYVGNEIKRIRGHVIKTQDPVNNKREVFALKKLTGYKHFPKLFKNTEDSVTIDYCGKLLTILPEDWKDQAEIILNVLTMEGIIHRDIIPRNLLIINGIIKLIDFSWAGSIGEKFETYPKRLGLDFKHPEKFDDEYSLYKSLDWIGKNGR